MADHTTTAYRAAAAVARALPGPVADGIARLAGRAVAQVPTGRRAQVERNLRRIYGDDVGRLAVRRGTAQTFEAYARYWVESFRLPGTTPEALDAGLSYSGATHIEDAMAKGKGVIMAMPHLGGWEWSGFWAAAVLGVPVTVVVESLDPPELFEWFADLRRSFGMNVLPLGPEVAGELTRALKANHMVALLCDRDIGSSGIEVSFFGERTFLPAGPAVLGLRTGATVLPTAIYHRGRRHHGVVLPPLDTTRQGGFRADVARVTQELADDLETLIRAAPEQWHLLQPNWPSDPGYRADVQPAPGPSSDAPTNPSAPTEIGARQ